MYHHIFFPFLPGVFRLIIFVVFLFPYFLPTIIAFSRKKDNAGGIFLLNFFLGWTLIGWIVCLIWALSENRAPVIINNAAPVYPPEYRPASQQTNPTIRPASTKTTSPQEKIDQLRQLKQLLDEGVLTEGEFNRQKAAILG
jgi:hypothetical protein